MKTFKIRKEQMTGMIITNNMVNILYEEEQTKEDIESDIESDIFKVDDDIIKAEQRFDR